MLTGASRSTLIASKPSVGVPPRLMEISAVSGFGLIMAVRWAYARVRAREGIGIGDAKLMAAAGAWVSWEGLPTVLLLAAGVGLVFSLAEAVRKREFLPQQALAFGPYIALGFWTVWLYGPLRYV